MAVLGAPLRVSKKLSLRGAFYTRTWRGIVVACAWPRERVRRRTRADKKRNERLTDLVTAIKWAPPIDIANAMEAVQGTPFLWRDLLTSQMTGHQIAPIELEGKTIYPETFVLQVLRALDSLSTSASAPLARYAGRWRAQPPGPPGSRFTTHGVGNPPTWE